MAAKSTWKNVERRVAGLFDSERCPLSGGNSKITRSDSLHPYLFVETKYRVAHSAVKLWRKTKDLAEKEIAPDGRPKIPVVALVEKGREGVFFVIHSSDLPLVISRTKFFRQYVAAIVAFCGGRKAAARCNKIKKKV